MTARRWASLAALALAGGLAYRRYTTPFPYAHRWMLDAELPGLTVGRLLAMLEPRPGERMLEIGPGTGLFSLPVARALEPGGALEILDVQQEMLDHTMRAAAERRIANLNPTRGDATALPYPDACFDGAFLVTALGEISGQRRALAELRRVLRPTGRLVVGEFLVDWHAVPRFLLERRAAAVGLRCTRHVGRLSYLARLEPAG